MNTPEESPRRPALPVSPRRRRLRLTVGIVALAALAGIIVGAVLHRRGLPQQYRPDEKLDEVTSSLSARLPPEAPRPKFTDETARAGLGAFRNFTGNRTSQIPEDMGPGLAWGDFDNDGFDDVFLVSAGGALTLPEENLLACELWRNRGDGTFQKVETFPELRIRGMAAAWGDYDGDGLLDLVVTGYDTLQLFHNEGGGKFVRDARFPNPKGFWAGASWGDYDNDRRLDLYICGYIQYAVTEADRNKVSMQVSTAVPFTLNPASFPPGTNLLFHNNGDGTFTETAAALGVANPEGRSLAAVWHDFDDDGWLDLYVANDVSDNVFYHNERGRFLDISHAAWVADYRSAMGIAVGDFDRDGDDDMFVTHWVAQENALFESHWANYAAARTNPPVFSRTNSPLRFTDIADMKGVGQMALPFVGWGTEFVDLDGDGWLDLAVANGSTIEFQGVAPKKLQPQQAFLLWNRRGGLFHDLAPLHPSFAAKHVSRGLAVADFDHDGAMDIAVTDLGEGVRLLRNEMQAGRWLKARLRNVNARGQPLGFGEGCTAIAHAGGAVLRRTVGGGSYLSQSSHTLHFGLGTATNVDWIEVRWIGGGTNRWTNLTAGTTWELAENAAAPRPFYSAARAPDSTLTNDRARVVEFWSRQRAAMNAMKVEKDLRKAAQLFRDALALDPRHEDSRYYLGHCLAALDDVPGALAELAELQRINPQSHRAWQQWGALRAVFAQSDADLRAAEISLERAHSLNPEETGALLVLGEVSLLRGDIAKADERLGAVCRSNPRAVGAFFLRAYIAQRHGGTARAQELLRDARLALGKEWQPKGTTAEGDVKQKQHVETTPLTRCWEYWDGRDDPASAFATLSARLSAFAQNGKR